MTLIVAIVPLLLTPLVAWLLMEFGPERSVVFVAYWLVLTIVFAIAMPYFRRRGRTLIRASVVGAAVALVMTFVVFLGLLFALTPRLRAATLATASTASRGDEAIVADTVVRTPPAGSATRTAHIPSLFPARFLDSDVPVQ